MINWLEIGLFAVLAPSSIVFLFWLIDAVTTKKWPFNDKKAAKVNSGGKFG